MTDFSFTIFNSIWTVSFIDFFPDTKDGEYRYGETDYEHQYIQIATKAKDGKPLPQTTVQLTLMHELMHAICTSGQYCDYSGDEPFIEWLANCLYSLKQQGKL